MSRARYLDRTVSLLLLAAGGLGGLVLAAQAWWRLTGRDLDPSSSAGAGVQTTISGTTATGGLAQALAVCVLAATLLALVLRHVGRRVVAVACLLLGLGMAVLGGWHPQPDATIVQTALRQVTLADDAVLRSDVWVWGYLAAGLVTVAGAVVMLLRCGTWPSRARRYESPTSARTRTGSYARGRPVVGDDPDTWWRAMSAGVDPTEREQAPDEAGSEGHPVSPSARDGATMAPKDVSGSSEDP